MTSALDAPTDLNDIFISALAPLFTTPHRTTVYGDCGHSLPIEPHRVTASGRELILREHFANPHEDQVFLVRSDELHPAKTHASVTAAVIGEDDLIRGQRHPETVGKQHKRTRRAVSDNRQHGDPIVLPEE